MKSWLQQFSAPTCQCIVASGAGGSAPAIEVRKDVEYAVHGGQSLKGTLYSPAAPGTHPVVIAIHGGAWKQGDRDRYQYLGPWLAARGHAVFAIDYRLAKTGQPTFPGAVQDARAAVQFIKGEAAALRIDPARVATMGDSAGGHLATMVALAGKHASFKDGNKADTHGHLSSAVKAVVSVYGVYDLAAQWRHDQTARPLDHMTEIFLGRSLLEDRRVYFDASPMSYVSVDNNATAVMLAWGLEDDLVKPEQSETFLEALKQTKHFVRTVCIPGAPHYWISDPIDEAGSFSAFFAVRLLRFLQAQL